MIHLGTGTLTWAARERIIDRYGTVYLVPDGDNSLTSAPSRSLILPTASEHAGQRGKLAAHVITARDSTHIGDLFRGIFPRRPEVGRIITLGTGILFTDDAPEGGIQVGLMPTDGRKGDWLDPRALYDAHEQTVALYFVQEG